MGHNMLPKSFYFNLTIRFILFLINALALAWAFSRIREEYIFLCLNLSILLVLQLWLIYRYISRIDRDLCRFLEAVGNNEYSGNVYDPKSKKGFDRFRLLLNQINDIVRQKSLELWEQELWFQEVINQSPGGLVIFSPAGQILHINPVALLNLGVERIFHIDELGKVQSNLPEMIREASDGSTFQAQGFLFRKSSMSSSKGKRVLLTFDNINKQLVQKETESWKKLIRVIRHEIMNSISPIPALSQSMRTGLLTDEKQLIPASDLSDADIERISNGLCTIEKTSASILEFVNRYRQLTSLPEVRLKHTGIIPLVQESVSLFREDFEKWGIQIDLKFDCTDVQVFADADLLKRVFINLIKNAIESILEVPSPEISIISKVSGNSLCIVVKDNGTGIQTEILDQIFVPFFTTKPDGSGIGLSLARQILIQHDGEISVTSSPGKGSSFIVTLPLPRSE